MSGTILGTEEVTVNKRQKYLREIFLVLHSSVQTSEYDKIYK